MAANQLLRKFKRNDFFVWWRLRIICAWIIQKTLTICLKLSWIHQPWLTKYHPSRFIVLEIVISCVKSRGSHALCMMAAVKYTGASAAQCHTHDVPPTQQQPTSRMHRHASPDRPARRAVRRATSNHFSQDITTGSDTQLPIYKPFKCVYRFSCTPAYQLLTS
jgi:hypothetical protein